MVSENSFTTGNMPLRRGASIGRGRLEANAVLLEDIWSLRMRMETIETAQRRTLDEGVDSAKEESS